MGHIDLSQIHRRSFAHPSDSKATQALEKVPLLPEVLKKVSKLRVEERFRAQHMLNSIELGPRQFPSLWKLVEEVSQVFRIPTPHAYLSRGGGVNAFAFGQQEYSIILTAELVQLMDEDEIRAIIAHELGHIMCEHMLYKSVGLMLANQSLTPLAKLAPAAVVASSLNRLFYAWSRAAEYSADRAALLALDDPEVIARCMGKLAGVPRRLADEFDLEAFGEQSRRYAEESSMWSKVVTLNMDAYLTHPEPVKRANAICEWAESDQYKEIRAGRYLTAFEAQAENRIQIEGMGSCRLCRSPVGEAEACAHCGLPTDPRWHKSCGRGHVNSTGWKFCKSCGEELMTEASSTSSSVRPNDQPGV